MKASWKTVKLNDVSELLADGDWIESKDQSDDGIRLIQTGNIGDGIFKDREEKARYISESTFKRLRCTEIFEGDCLVSRLPEPVGRSCILPRIPRSITAVDCSIIRFKTAAILPEYFCYYSQSRDYQRSVESKTSGTTRKRISRSHLSEIEIPLPPLAEQKRIVALLDEALAGIDEAKAKAEAAQSASGKIFESQVGLSFAENNDWKEATLSDLGKTLTGTTPPTANPEFYGEYIPFVKPADFNEDGTLVIDNHGLSKEGEKVARVTNPDSVLMVCIGATIGKTGYTTKRITTNQQINSFTPGSLVNFKFAYYQMVSSSFQKEVLARANQATMPMISKSKWSEINLRFPNSYDTQVKVAERLSEIKFLTVKLSETADRKVAALNEIRSSLLAQAFAGELTA